MEQAPIPGETISLADIERRMEEINQLVREIIQKTAPTQDAKDYTEQLESVMKEMAFLKEKKRKLLSNSTAKKTVRQ